MGVTITSSLLWVRIIRAILAVLIKCTDQQISAKMDDDNQIAVDIDREFTCFLCNGFITILGSVKVEDHLLILTAANG